MITHVVQPGDTMWKIARQHGLSLDSLIAANPQIIDPNRLSIGEVINVPTGADMGVAPGYGYNPKEKLTMPKPTAPMMPPAPPVPAPMPMPTPIMTYSPHVDIDVTYEHQEIIEKKAPKRPPYYIKCCVPWVDPYGNVHYKEVIYYPAGERVMRGPY